MLLYKNEPSLFRWGWVFQVTKNLPTGYVLNSIVVCISCVYYILSTYSKVSRAEQIQKFVIDHLAFSCILGRAIFGSTVSPSSIRLYPMQTLYMYLPEYILLSPLERFVHLYPVLSYIHISNCCLLFHLSTCLFPLSSAKLKPCNHTVYFFLYPVQSLIHVPTCVFSCIQWKAKSMFSSAYSPVSSAKPEPCIHLVYSPVSSEKLNQRTHLYIFLYPMKSLIHVPTCIFSCI
jgi:hypothetical protein